MSRTTNLVFEYRAKGKAPLSGLGKTGVLIWAVAFLSVFIGFIVFLVLAFQVNIKYIWLADILGILSFIFGPYSFYIKRFYLFALTEDNILYMKSAINAVPKKYKVDLASVSEIVYSNPVKAIAIEFKNKDGKILGRFNPLMIDGKQFRSFINIIAERNKNLQIKV
jgi:hypothetical protein